MQYINLPESQQSSFLRAIKNNTKYTWKQLANSLRVNRSMIYFYLNEHSKLPYNHYVKLCELAKIQKKVNINLVDIKNKEVKIRIPALSCRLAEFLGALAGDGHMNNSTYEISISLDKDLDKDYSDHIIDMYKKLFGLEARKYIQENKIKCFAYSKRLVTFLQKRFGIPVGKKKGKLSIPHQISNDKKLSRAYIRGIFDTDGSFHRHHKKDAMLGIVSRDYIFIKELKRTLEELGFTASLSNKNLYIYRKKEIDRFFREIKPANLKHVGKYLHYQEHGTVPLTKELLNR